MPAKAAEKKDEKEEKPEETKEEEHEEGEEEEGEEAEAEAAEEGEGAKPKSKRKIRKENLREKLNKAFQEYKSALIVNIDNVGSNQMQKVRIALRGQAILVMGKNTLIRAVIRENVAAGNKKLAALLPSVKENIGFVFTNGDLAAVRSTILANKVPAAAKSGTIAPSDVKIPPGSTGLDPGQTAFFQALNIATKIVRNAIEIVAEVHLIKAGDKVTASTVALLTKLNIKPFFYGIKVEKVYEDGSVFDVKVLDMTPADLYNKFFAAVARITAIGLEVGYPTLSTIPHSVSKGFRQLLAVALETDFIEFDEAKKVKEMLANPEAFVVKTEKKEEKKEEAAEEEVAEEADEEEDVGVGGMFGDDE